MMTHYLRTGLCEHTRQGSPIANVYTVEPRLRIDVFLDPPRQIIGNDDLMPLFDVSVGHMRSDETRSACNKNSHHTPLSLFDIKRHNVPICIKKIPVFLFVGVRKRGP